MNIVLAHRWCGRARGAKAEVEAHCLAFMMLSSLSFLDSNAAVLFMPSYTIKRGAVVGTCSVGFEFSRTCGERVQIRVPAKSGGSAEV